MLLDTAFFSGTLSSLLLGNTLFLILLISQQTLTEHEDSKSCVCFSLSFHDSQTAAALFMIPELKYILFLSLSASGLSAQELN